MKTALIRTVSILALPLLLLAYFAFVKESPADSLAAEQLPPVPPKRIISFAPSVTEILYELGQGENIFGVTQFCGYPPEAAGKERVGGHVDHNYEMILRLKPDLAVILKEQRELAAFLQKHSIRYIEAGSGSVDEIIASVQLVGRACHVGEKGDSLARSLRRRLENASMASSSVDHRPKVLLCVGRDALGSGAVSKCFAAGASSFYNQLVEAAGGINILKDAPQAYPLIGAEGIIRLGPEIIIDISSAYVKDPQETVCDDWNALKSVPAVKTGNVHCLYGDYLTIPGPRFVLILDDLKTIFFKYVQNRN